MVVLEPSRLITLGGAAIALMLVLAFVFRKLRRRWVESTDDAQQAGLAGFELGDLEAMRNSGHISDQEFRRLRDITLGKAGLLDKNTPGVAGAGPLHKENSAEASQLEAQKAGPELTSRPEDVDDKEDKERK